MEYKFCRMNIFSNICGACRCARDWCAWCLCYYCVRCTKLFTGFRSLNEGYLWLTTLIFLSYNGTSGITRKTRIPPMAFISAGCFGSEENWNIAEKLEHSSVSSGSGYWTKRWSSRSCLKDEKSESHNSVKSDRAASPLKFFFAARAKSGRFCFKMFGQEFWLSCAQIHRPKHFELRDRLVSKWVVSEVTKRTKGCTATYTVVGL